MGGARGWRVRRLVPRESQGTAVERRILRGVGHDLAECFGVFVENVPIMRHLIHFVAHILEAESFVIAILRFEDKLGFALFSSATGLEKKRALGQKAKATKSRLAASRISGPKRTRNTAMF